jgi:hypothetical protein
MAAETAVYSVDSKNPNAIVESLDLPHPQSEHDLEEQWKPRRVRPWKSPLVMLICYLVGLCMSISHCVFYPKLDARIVRDAYIQERNIR